MGPWGCSERANSPKVVDMQRTDKPNTLLGLSQLFQNNFGNNRLRLELENYSSLMGQNYVYKDYKRSKRCKREVQVRAGLGDIKTVYLITCVQVD